MSLPEPVDPSIAALNENALAAVAGGDADEANKAAADARSLLGVALSTYLRTAHHHDVYDQPDALEATRGCDAGSMSMPTMPAIRERSTS